jgi:hypothetical protein
VRRLLLLAGLALAVSLAVGDARGSCPAWPNWKPMGETYTAAGYIDAIILRADIELAKPETECDATCRLNWIAAREIAEWSRLHGQICSTNPLFHTCADYYYHVKFAYRRSYNGDPVGCFNELDHVD